MSSLEKQFQSGKLKSWLSRLFVFVLLISAGCGKPSTHIAVPISPSVAFSDDRGTWQHVQGELSNPDIQRIGSFFKQRPSLVGSPEWTGQPEKYVNKNSQSFVRFYWFSGSQENPSWNALEFNGSRARELSGVGIPGADENR